MNERSEIVAGSTDENLTIYDMYDNPRRYRATNGWSPIETAPKDGMHIIVANFAVGSIGYGYFRQSVEPVPFMTVAHYWAHPGEEGFYLSAGASSPVDDQPLRVTHWRPLPAPLSSGHARNAI